MTYRNPPLVGRGDVDGGVTRSRRDQQLQIRQFSEETAEKGRALPHGADDIEPPQAVGDGIGIGDVVIEYHDFRLRGHLAPVGHIEGDALIIVKNRYARHRIPSYVVGASGMPANRIRAGLRATSRGEFRKDRKGDTAAWASAATDVITWDEPR